MNDKELNQKINELQEKASELDKVGKKDEAFEVRCEISGLLQQNKPGTKELNESIEQSIEQNDE